MKCTDCAQYELEVCSLSSDGTHCIPVPRDTIRVRIAVAVTADGDWVAVGGTRRSYCASPPGVRVDDWELAADAYGNLGDVARLTWVEADVYLPAAVETVDGVTFEHGEDEDE